MTLLLLALALLLDRIVGDPDAVWRRVPHPVTLFGAAIALLERRLNRGGPRRRRLGGTLAILLLLVAAAGLGSALEILFALFGPVADGALTVIMAAVMLAWRSLLDHVRRVAEALDRGGVEAGRRAVAMIVGRDPAGLDTAAVARAAIESVSENASDGVVAPALWFALAGLPGLFAYKMLNTADSMIGHRTERYERFGWAAARLDDAANLVPARLTALLVAAGGAVLCGTAAAREGLRAARRDARLHRSPNAGWPEAAIAGVLGLRLGGPRRYGALFVDAPALNAAGRADATAHDIRQAVRVVDRGLAIGTAGAAAAAAGLALLL